MRFSLGRALRLSFGLSLAALALWLALSTVKVDELTHALASAQAGWLTIAVASTFLTVAVVVTRLRVLLRCSSIERAWKTVWNVTIVGQVANIVMPYRLGDAAKVVAGNRSLGAPAATMGGVVVIERLFDLMGLSAIAALLLAIGSVPGWAHAAVFAVALTGFGVLVAIFVASWVAVELPVLVTSTTGGVRGWLQRQYALLRDGLRHTRKPTVMMRLVVCSLLISSGSIFTNLLVIRALNLAVPIEAAALLWVILQCGNTLIPTPGGIGTSQLLTIVTLNLWAVSDASGFACSVLIYLISRVPKVALLPFALSGLERAAVANYDP